MKNLYNSTSAASEKEARLIFMSPVENLGERIDTEEDEKNEITKEEFEKAKQDEQIAKELNDMKFEDFIKGDDNKLSVKEFNHQYNIEFANNSDAEKGTTLKTTTKLVRTQSEVIKNKFPEKYQEGLKNGEFFINEGDAMAEANKMLDQYKASLSKMHPSSKNIQYRFSANVTTASDNAGNNIKVNFNGKNFPLYSPHIKVAKIVTKNVGYDKKTYTSYFYPDKSVLEKKD